MQKIPKNSKILVIFEFPTIKLVYNSFLNIWENVVYFFLLCGEVEKLLRIFAKQLNLKKLKWSV